MAQSHYHEYFELYYLETGERFHMVQDSKYKKMTAALNKLSHPMN